MALPNPVAAGQAPHQRPVQLPGMAVVDVFYRGLLLQTGIPESVRYCLVFPPGPLRVDEHRQPLLKAERSRFGLFELLLQGLSHPVQFEFIELLEGLFAQHQHTSVFR